jgi:hypothetical protein
LSSVLCRRVATLRICWRRREAAYFSREKPGKFDRRRVFALWPDDYAKRPFGEPDAVLAYLSRYTHRTAVANSRLVAFAGERVTFKWKDYRAKGNARYKLMTLDADEFIRRFLIHVLPDGFHRIRHYGLFANANRANNIALARRLLAVPDPTPSSRASDHAENGRDDEDWNACPCCGGRMIIVEAFEPGCQPRFWPVPSIGLDSS